MTSSELSDILQHWWKPPHSLSSHKSQVKGGREAMENFASECMMDLLDRELEAVGKLFLSPAGEDICKENFTGMIFEEMVNSVKNGAPWLWSIL